MKNKIVAGALVVIGLIATYGLSDTVFGTWMEREIVLDEGSDLWIMANYLERVALFHGLMLWLILIGVAIILCKKIGK